MKKFLWLVPLALALPALAVIPQFWEIRTYEQFRRGQLEGLSVTGDGTLVPAPNFNMMFDTQAPLVFGAATDSQGNVYLGTGHDGKVYRVDSGGTGDVWVDLGELDVMALAVSDDDTLFVATSPNGRVYRIAATGDAEVFFEPGVRYIWALAFDMSGRLLVATGDEGVIYSVASDGQSEIFYDSDETHIISMVLDSSGSVIAGGEPKGYVYRISPSGEPFVLYDSGMREVRSVVLDDDGTVYAAVINAAGRLPRDSSGSVSGGPSQGPSISVTVENTQEGFDAQSVQGGGRAATLSPRGSGDSASAAGARATPQSRILQIAPSGAVTAIWESDDEMVFGLLPQSGGLLFSTGTNGRIYSLRPPERATLLLESSEEQITSLLSDGARVLATSSNAGKLFEIGDSADRSGFYESEVRNTGAISSWGKVVWTGQGVEILTRSGNTSSPDRTWSDWAPLGTDGGVTSPSARFIQWRAEFESDFGGEAMLASVRLPYLEQNFRPEISGVDVLRSGIALENLPTANNSAGSPTGLNGGEVSGRVFPTGPRVPTRTIVRPGAQSLSWEARDANDDVLVYSIVYRAENEGEWKMLEDGITDTFYTVQPDTLPDGMYIFRVMASDIGSNPIELALIGQLDTAPFAIDNTPPLVVVEQRGVDSDRVSLYVDASDATSTLKQAQVSVDAGPWRPVFPVDGIVDSQSETFQFSSVELDSGEHVVAFRIYDQNENVGIGKAIVQIP